MEFKEKEMILKDGSKCIFRSPKEEDAEYFIEYLEAVAGETHYLTMYPEEVTISVDQEKEFIKNISESKSDMMLSAFINNEVAANASISCISLRKKAKHRASLGIAVKEKFWGKGIGNILMKELIKQAKIMGFEQIELGVYSDNTKAQSLYKKYGFEVWGTTKNAFKLKDGTYCDDLTMGKIL